MSSISLTKSQESIIATNPQFKDKPYTSLGYQFQLLTLSDDASHDSPTPCHELNIEK
jgi:hypothetical protein